MTTGANPMSQEVPERIKTLLHTVEYYAGEDTYKPLTAYIAELRAELEAGSRVLLSHEGTIANLKRENRQLRVGKDGDDNCMSSMLEEVNKQRQRAEAAEAGAASALQAAKKLSDEWDEEFKCVCGRKGHYVEADTVDDMLEACKAGSAFLAWHKLVQEALQEFVKWGREMPSAPILIGTRSESELLEALLVKAEQALKE